MSLFLLNEVLICEALDHTYCETNLSCTESAKSLQVRPTSIDVLCDTDGSSGQIRTKVTLDPGREIIAYKRYDWE